MRSSEHFAEASEMKTSIPTILIVSISINNAFLHPLLNLGPDIIPDRIAGRMGFPAASFWTQKRNSPGKAEQKAKLDGLWNLANNAICSYPCQRISHFIKFEDVLRKKGLDYEIRLVFILNTFFHWPANHRLGIGIFEIRIENLL